MRTRARGTTRNRTPRVEVRIPGFTAEAGLQRTSAIWRGGTFFAARGHETGVEPQFCFASSRQLLLYVLLLCVWLLLLHSASSVQAHLMTHFAQGVWWLDRSVVSGTPGIRSRPNEGAPSCY